MSQTKIKITPNINQQKAIDAIFGTVMVLAGPGTGKTFVTIERIAKMLESGVKPSEILCLTYSEAAASEMKTRLIKKTANLGASVQISTYHSFCNEIIKKYPSKFELFEDVKLVDEISKINIAKLCMDELKPESLKSKWGDYYFYIKGFLSSVDEIKKNRIDEKTYFHNLKFGKNWQKKLEALIFELEERKKQGKTRNVTLEKNILNQQKKIEKAKELWALYDLYCKKLSEKNFIDFNDMINFVAEAFENDEIFLRQVASRYKYFLVDEYQDTNFLQNQIVFLLAKGSNSKNIFVVGDDDQIIFGFQGAKNDNLENFLQNYPETKVICLEENNRSTQNILDLSYDVISQDKSRLEYNKNYEKYQIKKKLVAKNSQISSMNKKIEFSIYNEFIQENNSIVDKIEELAYKNSENLDEIAILCRENAELQEFASLLEARGINFQIKINKSIFEVKSSILVYFYLKALNNQIFSFDKLFGILMNEPFCFDDEDFCFILKQNHPTNKSVISILKDNIEHSWKNKEKVIKFLNTYEHLSKLKSYKSPKALIWHLINETGILQFFASSEIDTFENLSALNRIMEEADAFEKLNRTQNLDDFVKHLDFAFSQNIPIEIDKNTTRQNAVQLVTLHGSKGREFEYVFMPHLISNRWEDKSVRNNLDLPLSFEDDENDEQKRFSENLRLLFVGVTRAKHYLHLSFSTLENGKPKCLTCYLNNVLENEQIVQKNIFEESSFNIEDELKLKLSMQNIKESKAFQYAIENRIKNLILSPHTLSSYLNCPRAFLYGTIYRLKNFDKDTVLMDFGNAVHNSIDKMVNIAKETGKYPSKEKFLQFFEEILSKSHFESETDFAIYLQRGKNSLESYYCRLVSTEPKHIFKMEFDLGEIEFDNVKITGRIDRVEVDSKGNFSLFDYKTGSAKPKSQIQDGKNYENYLDQLRFYKFAFEKKYPNFKVAKTGLLFVEEFEKSIYLDLDENDDEIIKNKIKFVFDEVKKMNFEPIEEKNQMKNEKCKFCDFKVLCKLDNHK